MKLFNVDKKGDLIELEKLDFQAEDVYLIDDSENHTIYVWVGNDVDQDKKDITARLARKIDKDKGGSCKILIMKQKREYGSFMAMMEDLKKGLIPGKTTEKRPELKLDSSVEIEAISEDDLENRITAWLSQYSSHIEVKKDDDDLTDLVVDEVKDELITDKDTIVPEKEIEDASATEQRIIAWLKQLLTIQSGDIEPVEEFDELSEVYEEEPRELDAISWLRRYISARNITVEEIIESMKRDGIKPSFLNERDDTDFESKVRVGAYFISLSKNSYDDLCWYLAEKIQNINLNTPTEDEIRTKAEEIFQSSSTYDELCWLNAEMDLLIRGRFFEL